MDKPWCMCTKLNGVLRDSWSTCVKCGGKDAYGQSDERPKKFRKVLKEDKIAGSSSGKTQVS